MKAYWFLALVLPVDLAGQNFAILPGRTEYSHSDTVIVTFKIQDDQGLPINTISAAQVSVTENGKSIETFSFSNEPLPLMDRSYVVMVLDRSGSMRYQGKISRLREAAKKLIDAMKPEDFCSIIAFSSKPRLLTGFSNNKAELIQAIDNLAPEGYTAIYDAVWEALAQVESQPHEIPKVILLITDGSEEGESLFGISEIAPRLQMVPNLTLHVFDLNKSLPVSDLRRLAKLGRGGYHYNPKPEIVFKAFGEFLTENRKTFSVRYRPEPHGPTSRSIAISVRLNNLEQKFESNYSYVPAESPMNAALIAVGFVTACVVGAAGTVVYTKKRKARVRRTFPVSADPLLVEAPKMVFDMVGGENGEEKTHALSLDPEEDGEKTIIIENRKKEVPVFGHLSVTNISGDTQVLDIDSPEVLFGRSNQCKVRFDNMEVSRLHAKLRLEADGFVLYDLGSANGTLVNGEEVQKRLLRQGDEIEVGKNRIAFYQANGHQQ